MFKQYSGSIVLAASATFWLYGCAKKSDETCDCTYNDVLPQPAKVIRKGSGFQPTVYFFSVDLTSGDAEYEKTDGVESEETCKGSLNVTDELAEWRDAAELLACTRVLNNPVSDGYIDSMVLYFPATETPPQSLATNVDGDWVTVELQEKFVDSVQGRQQFDCTGQFAIDSLIIAKAQCLGIE